jgi:hypothetical protein
MTLLEIQRLTRKISDALQDSGSNPSNPKLAEDFAAACHAVNLRLQQCEAMVKAGDRHQAIQLAETQPNLLDCVTALEFREADQWRSHCEKQGLPVADKIDARSVHSLNECYAQGISTDHPLYAVYRSAVLSRNDEDALKALQSIAKLNPGDTNAASELIRLDAKVLQAKLSHLDDLLAGGSPELIVAQVEAIEGFGFKNQPAGDPWRSAQLVRCGRLLEEVEKLHASSNWMEALVNLDFIQRLQADFKLQLNPASLRKIETLGNWARTEQEKYRRDREFQILLAELHFRIQQSEEKDTSARLVKLGEMKDDSESLHKVWRSLQDFTRPIPEDATAAFRKRSTLLETEIVRRTMVRRRAVIFGVIAVLLVGGITSWVALAQLKARDLARQLNEAASQRQVRAAEKLLTHINNQKHLLGAGPLRAAAAAAETFSAKERSLLKNFQEAYAKLPKDLGSNPTSSELTATSDALANARNALGSLAPDLKAENQPILQSFEQRWEKLLAQSSTAANTLFERWLTAAETKSAELDYRSSLEQIRPLLASLSNQVCQISTCESGFTNHLVFRSDLLQRSAALQAKFTAYDKELRKLDGGCAGLQRAKTTGEFSEALNQIAASEYSTSPLARAAAAMQGVEPNGETALRFLLGATNASVWAFIKKSNNTRFIPEAAFPAEGAILARLSRDPAISARHQRVRLWLDAEGASFKEWITAGQFADGEGWTTIKAYEPYSSPRKCEFADREYGFFDGRYKLTPTQPIYKIQHLGTLSEAAASHTVGLEGFFGATAYSKPLLEVLDAVKDSREGSSVFRAYLFLQLVDIMELQPESWGLAFAPAISHHRTQILGLIGEPLSSGDWFVPEKATALANGLDQFFTSASQVSYTKQAAGMLALAREASAAGFRYAGYADLDGQPKAIDNLPDGEIWGYSARTKQGALLGLKAGSKVSLDGAVMPLSPLFTLPTRREQLLAKAGVSAGSPTFEGALPLLFSPSGVAQGSQP